MTPNRFSTSKPQTQAMYEYYGTPFVTLGTYGRAIMNANTYMDAQSEFWVIVADSFNNKNIGPYQINIFRVDCKDKRKVQLWVTT